MKKIMFNDRFGLTEAVLSGRKTQTRRIIPKSVLDKADDYRVEYYNGTLSGISEKEAIEQIYFAEKRLKLPYKVGEVVAVAQSYKDVGYDSDAPLMEADGIGGYVKTKYSPGWTNKMFVRADLMPHHIRITDVKVERLQDISDKDCFKEGVRVLDFDPMNPLCDLYDFPSHDECFGTPQNAYAAVIDRISGRGTWDSKPFVFVYDFELVD